MRDFLRLKDFDADELREIFRIADGLREGRYENALKGKTAALFFPGGGVRTRIAFEKGVFDLGGQTVLFSSDVLDKREETKDVFGYLDNWADMTIVRHKEMAKVEEIARWSDKPVVNAMTDECHPCEILSDLYALSRMRGEFAECSFLFCGADGNIGRTWKEASEVFDFRLEQCCPPSFAVEGLRAHSRIEDAIVGKDIICTDSLPESAREAFADCRVSLRAMRMANPGALLNPCPPFYRGEEVTGDAVDSPYFVGYAFKKCLLEVQQAVLIACL